MIRFFIRLLVNAAAIWVAVQLVPGLNYVGSTTSLLIVALLFGVMNALVRPLLLLLTCPFIILTLGLFVLVVNTIMLSLTVWLSGIWDLGLTSSGFWATFLGAVVISIVSSIINLLIKDDNEDNRRK
jgi:putative membrane protein